MLLGTYHLQGIWTYIHRNHLIKSQYLKSRQTKQVIGIFVCSSPVTRIKYKPVASDPENTSKLKHQLLQVDEAIPGPLDPPEPVEEEQPSQVPVPSQMTFRHKESAETLVGSDWSQSNGRTVEESQRLNHFTVLHMEEWKLYAK